MNKVWGLGMQKGMQPLHDTCEPHENETSAALRLAEFIASSERLFVLTGAGCSAPSGIPAYRDHAGRWLGADPMQHIEFLRNPAKRRRYWQRSFAGWPKVEQAEPNPAHLALAALERQGRLLQVVTQNVDGLHQRAGSRRVIDLHGRLDQVDCLDCGERQSRRLFQARLAGLNPSLQPAAGTTRPDGDHEPAADADGITVPACENCGGVMKPNVVFFGANVPRARVQRAQERLAEADAMLIVGSSLRVLSGYRFVKQATAQALPIALANLGTTRADDDVSVKFRTACDRLLPAAIRVLHCQYKETPRTAD